MLFAIGLVVFVVAFIVLWKEVAAKNRPRKFSKLAGAAAVVLIAILVLLAASGRLHWLLALAAGVLPFLRWIAGLLIGPLVGRWFRTLFSAARPAPAGGAAAPQVSTVATADLRMTLQHDSGDMDGEVLRGSLRGSRLSDLDLDALRALRADFAAADSLQLLDAYLERRFPGWQGDGEYTADGRGAPPSAPPMDEAQALQVLGLAPEASRDDVVDAHRRLMQKLHPDRGGTDYLAATLNQAKEVLLDARA